MYIMLFINSWTGRFGNNILQLIRAIYYAECNQHSNIKFIPHPLLNTTVLNIGTNNNPSTKTNTFFNLKQLGLKDPSPKIMRNIFRKHVKPICKLNFDKPASNHLFIHIRGGDIFSNNPHPAYVQPPLSYYNKIIKEYNSVTVVSEDKRNPCINELLRKSNCNYVSDSLKNDLELLLSAKYLVIGFGTFGFLIYLMSSNIKNLYVPSYFLDELPEGEWGKDIILHKNDLPNYIKVGEWKNSEKQRNLMINYNNDL